MRIAVSAESDAGLAAPVAGHFGRCPFFVFAAMEADRVGRVEVVANPFYPAHEPGQVPAFIHGQGADVMLAGGMGARAAAFFEQYGIQPVTGACGTVGQAIESYRSGALGNWAPCSESVEHGHGLDHSHDHGHQHQMKVD